LGDYLESKNKEIKPNFKIWNLENGFGLYEQSTTVHEEPKEESEKEKMLREIELAIAKTREDLKREKFYCIRGKYRRSKDVELSFNQIIYEDCGKEINELLNNSGYVTFSHKDRCIYLTIYEWSDNDPSTDSSVPSKAPEESKAPEVPEESVSPSKVQEESNAPSKAPEESSAPSEAEEAAVAILAACDEKMRSTTYYVEAYQVSHTIINDVRRCIEEKTNRYNVLIIEDVLRISNRHY